MNQKPKKSVNILIAEDDDDDFLLTKKALNECRLINEIFRVNNGEELIEFLKHQGQYADRDKNPRPHFILLDLNMPKIDGREALGIIKSDDDLKSIPVAILTTSESQIDIQKTYNLGVNSFITKPVGIDSFMKAVKELSRYWFEIVALPEE